MHKHKKCIFTREHEKLSASVNNESFMIRFLRDLWSLIVMRNSRSFFQKFRRSPGAISLFTNDLSTVISGIYCGIRASEEENKFQSIIHSALERLDRRKIRFLLCADCDLWIVIFSVTTYYFCQHNKQPILAVYLICKQ